MIRVVSVLDPFRPGTQRITTNIEHTPGMMLDAAILAAGEEPTRTIAVVGGKGIPPELAAGFPVEDGGEIILMPYVGGGGFLKTFAEIAVLVAAAVVTYGLSSAGMLGAFFASAGLGNLSAGAVGLIGSGIALGGNLLISMFMSSSPGGNDSATYDPTGPKTVASGGTPIPKGYGTMRWGGNIIASYVDAEGEDNYLNVLVCFGWGPAVSITDIRLNNTSIEDYTDVTYMVRLGSNTQTPIPYFNNIVNGYPQAVRVIALAGGGSPVVVQGTGTETQGLEVVIQFPTGVFYSNDDGSLRSLSIAYKVEYSVSGQNNWQVPIIPRTTSDVVVYNEDGTISSYPAWVVIPTDGNFSSGVIYSSGNGPHTPGDYWSGTQTVTYYNADGSSYTGSIFLQGEWQRCDPNLNQQIVTDWSGGYIIFTDADQATLYHTTKIFNLPPNKYDVRVTKYGSAFAGDPIQPREGNSNRAGDQIWIHSINEVQYQDLAYPNMILLGVRALATDQLSGNGLNVTALVTHDITSALPTELASYEHDNPAVVAYDMLTADPALYGGGLSYTQLDLVAMAQWAAYNDQLVSDGFTGQIRRHVFNGVFDQQNLSLWKALQKVCMMSNCIPSQIGQNYTFAIDGPVTVPAQVFTSSNIKKDSIKDTWFSLDDRCNRVEVTFADAGRDYRTDEPCAVMTPSDIQAGVEVKTTRVQLLGCTSRAQAWHWAYRKLMDTKTVTLTRSFDVNVEGVACQIGSVIGVQDDVTQWAEGGRIQFGSTPNSLIADNSGLTFAAGQGWTVSVVHPTFLRGSATVQTSIGNLLTFTSNLPAGRVLRCVRASDGLQATITGYGTNNATLEAPAFAPGDVLSFYDQDVIDTQLVSAYTGSSITPASPFLQAPVADSPWVYGQSAGAFPAKLFRVSNLKRKGDFDFTIDCIIYDPSIYADDTPIITEALGVPDADAAVTGLNLTENYSMANGGNAGQLSTISVGWQNGQTTVETELWIAQNEPNQPLSSESLLTTVSKGTTYTFPAPTGAIIQIRAVGVDAAGTTASWSNAPAGTITVQGAGTAPGDVTGFKGNFAAGTTTLTWNAATGAANYELRYNSDPNNVAWEAGVLLYSGNAATFADTTIRSGLYLLKALSSNSVESINAATFSLQQSSSYLNALGLAPSQSIEVTNSQNSYDSASGLCTVAYTWAAQTLMRTDGSTVVMRAGSLTWTKVLAPSTTYYIYFSLRLSDMTLHSVAGDPPTIPDTSPNATRALQAAADGYWQGPNITITTPNASGTGGTDPGGGYGGNAGTCPEANELVMVRDRGLVRAGDVGRGDYVRGFDMQTGEECWRRVAWLRMVPASAWYMVRGYCMSPLDDVWLGGEWQKPYLVGELDTRDGVRAGITIDADVYDEQNYFLYPANGGDRLLIHNERIEPC